MSCFCKIDVFPGIFGAPAGNHSFSLFVVVQDLKQQQQQSSYTAGIGLMSKSQVVRRKKELPNIISEDIHKVFAKKQTINSQKVASKHTHSHTQIRAHTYTYRELILGK